MMLLCEKMCFCMWCSLGASDKLEKLLNAAGECKKILVFSGSGLSAATGNVDKCPGAWNLLQVFKDLEGLG